MSFSSVWRHLWNADFWSNFHLKVFKDFSHIDCAKLVQGSCQTTKTDTQIILSFFPCLFKVYTNLLSKFVDLSSIQFWSLAPSKIFFPLYLSPCLQDCTSAICTHTEVHEPSRVFVSIKSNPGCIFRRIPLLCPMQHAGSFAVCKICILLFSHRADVVLCTTTSFK